MTRIAKERLASRVGTLNMLLDRPVTRFSLGATASQQNIGHLTLDKNSDGYKLVEIVSSTGAEISWSPRSTSGGIDMFITGIINSIAILLKAAAEQHKLTPDAALYSDANAAMLRSIKSIV